MLFLAQKSVDATEADCIKKVQTKMEELLENDITRDKMTVLINDYKKVPVLEKDAFGEWNILFKGYSS